MTNQSIRALYGSLVAMTLQLDNALSQKLDARGFLHLLVMFHDLNAAERAAFFAAVPKRD
jgi:hypothetical protein